MDYKELIKKLEQICYEVGDSVNRYYDGADEVLKEAATAIETMLEEREAQLETLMGDCRFCKNKPSPYQPRYMGKIVASGKCTTCKHAIKEMALPINNILQDKENWEWRRPTLPDQEKTGETP